jgi:hypothetical protein
MTGQIKQKVDQLFDIAIKQYSNSTFCESPVTGEHFVPPYDPIEPHKERAIRALKAQERFAAEKSSDMPGLPLNVRRDDPGSFKWRSGLHYLVDLYLLSALPRLLA